MRIVVFRKWPLKACNGRTGLLSRGLLWFVLLGEFTLKPAHTHAGTVEFPHNEAVFFHKITDRSISILGLHKPLVQIDMSFNDIFLGFQNFLQMLTRSDHKVV